MKTCFQNLKLFLSLSVLVCLFKTRVRIIVCRKLGTLFLELWYIVLHFYLEWCCYSYFVNQFTKVIYWKFDNFSSTCFFKTNWSTRMSTTHLQVIWLKTIVNRWFSEEIDTNQSKSHRFLFILPLWEYFACFSSDCFWWEFFSFHLFFLIEWNSSLVHLFFSHVSLVFYQLHSFPPCHTFCAWFWKVACVRHYAGDVALLSLPVSGVWYAHSWYLITSNALVLALFLSMRECENGKMMNTRLGTRALVISLFPSLVAAAVTCDCLRVCVWETLSTGIFSCILLESKL